MAATAGCGGWRHSWGQTWRPAWLCWVIVGIKPLIGLSVLLSQFPPRQCTHWDSHYIRLMRQGLDADHRHRYLHLHVCVLGPDFVSTSCGVTGRPHILLHPETKFGQIWTNVFSWHLYTIFTSLHQMFACICSVKKLLAFDISFVFFVSTFGGYVEIAMFISSNAIHV